jgi:hypothetical protein
MVEFKRNYLLQHRERGILLPLWKEVEFLYQHCNKQSVCVWNHQASKLLRIIPQKELIMLKWWGRGSLRDRLTDWNLRNPSNPRTCHGTHWQLCKNGSRRGESKWENQPSSSCSSNVASFAASFVPTILVPLKARCSCEPCIHQGSIILLFLCAIAQTAVDARVFSAVDPTTHLNLGAEDLGVPQTNCRNPRVPN